MPDDTITQMWDRSIEAISDAEHATARAAVALQDLRIAVRLAKDRMAALRVELRKSECPTTNDPKQR